MKLSILKYVPRNSHKTQTFIWWKLPCLSSLYDINLPIRIVDLTWKLWNCSLSSSSKTQSHPRLLNQQIENIDRKQKCRMLISGSISDCLISRFSKISACITVSIFKAEIFRFWSTGNNFWYIMLTACFYGSYGLLLRVKRCPNENSGPSS